VKTNAGFLARCLTDPDFIGEGVDTAFIETRLNRLVGDGRPSAAALSLAAAVVLASDADDVQTPWSALGGAAGFRLNGDRRTHIDLILGGERVRALVLDADFEVDDGAFIETEDEVVVFDGGDVFAFGRPYVGAGAVQAGVSDGQLLSPMPGRIVSVGAEAGAKVVKGQAIVTLEAMKMEHVLIAPFDGVLAELNAKAGDQVSEGVVLARLEDAR
jgi:acetyl/propionyl-CoA carboxylase alpha subunit